MIWSFGSVVFSTAIFALSAFEPVDKDLDWSLVYPELAGGEAKTRKVKAENPTEAQGLLSQKLDNLLKDAKILKVRYERELEDLRKKRMNVAFVQLAPG